MAPTEAANTIVVAITFKAREVVGLDILVLLGVEAAYYDVWD